MSPVAIVLTGAGAAAAILVGLGPVWAVVGGLLGWGAKVATALPAAPTRPAIRPNDLADPWSGFVKEALDAQARFDRTVARSRPGPIRDRLGTIGQRIGEGVDQSWAIAQRAQELAEARAAIDTTGVERRLERGAVTSDAERQALESQLATTRRLDGVINDAYGKLRLLDARLDEAVARAIELSVQNVDAAELESVDHQVGDVVMELEALRLALDESSSVGHPTPGVALAEG